MNRRSSSEDLPIVHVVGVYRERFGQRFKAMLDEQCPHNWSISLWALDQPHPMLDAWTVGCGPGGKFDLLNRILDRVPVPPGRALVVTDDDLTLSRGTIPQLLSVMSRGQLGLAQPAHGRLSRGSHLVNRQARLSVARLTSFVEIGPLFAVLPPWVERIAPFPPDLGMGWGLEVLWSKLTQEGCRLGVVDSVCFQHEESPNVTYRDRLDEEFKQLDRLLDQEGLSSLRDLQHVSGTWRRWQRSAPWLSD